MVSAAHISSIAPVLAYSHPLSTSRSAVAFSSVSFVAGPLFLVLFVSCLLSLLQWRGSAEYPPSSTTWGDLQLLFLQAHEILNLIGLTLPSSSLLSSCRRSPHMIPPLAASISTAHITSGFVRQLHADSLSLVPLRVYHDFTIFRILCSYGSGSLTYSDNYGAKTLVSAHLIC